MTPPSEARRGATVAPAPEPDGSPVVFVVDDDVSVRESLEALLRHEGWRVETFASGSEFLARLPAESASCLVLDVSLPGVSGLDLQRNLTNRRAEMPIIFITGHGDIPTTVQAMRAGATEFLTKPFHDAVFLSAVRNALDRSQSVRVRQAETRALRERYASLSRREQQVMLGVIAGRLNKQIAAELGISEITVKAHRGRVMGKMRAQSVPDLVRMAASLTNDTIVQ